MENKKVYNINAMRPVLLAAHEQGNRRMIDKKFCAEHGVSEGYFKVYKKNMETLFEAVSAYARAKNSPKAKPSEVLALREAIFPLWREMLSCGERTALSKELRVQEYDVDNLVGFCQKFMDDRNDVSRGEDKTFQSHKVWSVTPLRFFTRSVETDLGIRIAQVEVLSDEDRDFLMAEKKILNKWKKAEKRIGELTGTREGFVTTRKAMQSEEARSYLDQKIQELDVQLSELREKVSKCAEDHKTLLAKRNGEEVPEEPTPKKRRRKAKKAEGTDVESKAEGAPEGSEPETVAVPKVPEAETTEVSPEVA